MIEKESQFWAESWDRHASDYFTTPPHLGPCLELLFPDKSWTYLEMGGGTMRDARYLAQTGRSVTGSDSVEEVVSRARLYHGSALNITKIDAFHTGLTAKSFDVTYHNGVWSNFSNDRDIRQLAAEQARISRRYMVAVVHCRHNQPYRETFRARSVEDPLYDIRFFEIDELRSFMESFGPTRIYPCGSPLAYQLADRWRWGRLPQSIRSLIYRHVAPRTSPKDWFRIIAVTRLY